MTNDQPALPEANHVTRADSSSVSALLTRADLPQIVERYRSGESLTKIAEETTVGFRELYNWMFSDLGEGWKALQREVRVNLIADADRMTLLAADKVQVARARTFASSARMNLERLDPELYGEKRQVKTDSTINVIIQRDAREKLVQPSELVRTSTNNNIIDVTQAIDNAGE